MHIKQMRREERNCTRAVYNMRRRGRGKERRRGAPSSRTCLEVANKEQRDKDSGADEDDGDTILVGRGTLIARTEEPIEDVTTTRRF